MKLTKEFYKKLKQLEQKNLNKSSLSHIDPSDERLNIFKEYQIEEVEKKKPSKPKIKTTQKKPKEPMINWRDIDHHALKDHRLKQNITIEMISEATNITIARYKRIEYGTSPLKKSELNAICDMLKIQPTVIHYEKAGVAHSNKPTSLKAVLPKHY